MRGRSATEQHRAATPLELFFDLVFVIAIAQAASGLHHAITGHHFAEGIVRYAMAFFGIWWAWMNFTWFASAYDCDDVPYRLTVFVQMTGALIFTAGIDRMFAAQDFTLGVAGYVVMRLSMVAQWMRAARGDPSHRVTALRYARGIGLVQVVWVALLFVPVRLFLPGFVLLGIVELLIPAWAERAGMTPWHPHHVTERYGLMTIIVLGESVLAATMAAQQAIASDRAMADLAPLIVGGLLIVLAMWWLYFDHSAASRLTNLKRAMTWGYGHYLVFAAAAAVGAGLAVALDHDIDKARISDFAAGAAVAIPVAVYLSVLWMLHGRNGPPTVPYMAPVAVALVLLAPLTNHAVPLIGLSMVALLAAKLLVRARVISSGTAWWRGS